MGFHCGGAVLSGKAPAGPVSSRRTPGRSWSAEGQFDGHDEAFPWWGGGADLPAVGLDE